jgi:hypothetical protein
LHFTGQILLLGKWGFRKQETSPEALRILGGWILRRDLRN